MTFCFTTRQLMLWLTIYASLLAVLMVLPIPPVHRGAAIAVVTIFVLIDLVSSPKRMTSSRAPDYAFGIAHYATAFATATAVCYELYKMMPEPPALPKSPGSFLGDLLYVASGQIVADIGQAIGDALRTEITYCQVFALFCAIAFISSLFATRQFPAARWYTLLSSPGTCLFVFFFLIAPLIDAAGG